MRLLRCSRGIIRPNDELDIKPGCCCDDHVPQVLTVGLSSAFDHEMFRKVLKLLPLIAIGIMFSSELRES